ncbi:sugar O-acetyltransferase [Microbacterium rhizomatis]|uniref:Sugar O-acetyltransferase n=1 Tax=Microbacterium rhizomatis TaxID=1631477 RepID=A0A5J5J0B6_9MICO|nr:sugar O-acetyltransferase [Microbacterium rhizomatis]KAA9107951.1 sugar O-acetyltransferase [Microbacterium rhizomatis]
MTLADLLAALEAGDTVTAGSPAHATMIQTSEEALRICAELNRKYDGPERVRELLGQLTGQAIDESVTLFPPFTSDFGKNITIGKRVFINSGCRFQDQGGITIGDDSLIGHNAVIATLQHDIEPTRRANVIPFPVIIGRNVWLGANVTVLPGVTIGDDAVIGAGSVVTKRIPPRTIAVGSPARVVRAIGE